MDKYSAGGTGFLDTVEFARLQEEIISPQDKAMGPLEQVGISVAFQEENARLATASISSASFWETRSSLDCSFCSQDNLQTTYSIFWKVNYIPYLRD